MTTQTDTPPEAFPPFDVCLLLRAHALQHWLDKEVMPVLSELEDRESVPEEQVTAALAYLEVLWLEASLRAAETDAAFAKLNATTGRDDEEGLQQQVRSYHESVRRLHKAVEEHVTELVAPPADLFEASSPVW